MWQPIETAPKDQFLLLCGPSGYTTTPMVVTTGRMCSDYHAGRWIDHANDDLTDWGFKPTHWAPLTLHGAQPAPSEGSITAGTLSGMFLSLDGHDKAQPGYEWRKGWNDAIRQAMDYAQPAPSIPEGWKEGVEDVAAMLQKKADDYADEYGYDDMGGLSFGGGMGGEIKMDYYNNLIELIEEVRAMLAATPEAKP